MLKNFGVFLYDIKQEIRRVAWLKKQEILSSLFIVMVVMLCFSIFFYLVDFILLYVIKALYGIVYGI
ncbi:MAG: preprotein translocase subunit SecE [Wolbachia endosymbiont of Menacanthus eurysternus]|nr:MAG: preprotein translocase subunit SecE [Wolbachia endosymbiont of Menacanthus eurysternus]